MTFNSFIKFKKISLSYRIFLECVCVSNFSLNKKLYDLIYEFIKQDCKFSIIIKIFDNAKSVPNDIELKIKNYN